MNFGSKSCPLRFRPDLQEDGNYQPNFCEFNRLIAVTEVIFVLSTFSYYNQSELKSAKMAPVTDIKWFNLPNHPVAHLTQNRVDTLR